ncbi:unnamed protein product [Fusarium graminearum]|nr:unnamed protein product [Fusarium graminearum]
MNDDRRVPMMDDGSANDKRAKEMEVEDQMVEIGIGKPINALERDGTTNANVKEWEWSDNSTTRQRHRRLTEPAYRSRRFAD